MYRQERVYRRVRVCRRGQAYKRVQVGRHLRAYNSVRVWVGKGACVLKDRSISKSLSIPTTFLLL